MELGSTIRPATDMIQISGVVDLRERGIWAPVPPEGWAPVTDVCRVVHSNLDELTARTVRAITSEIEAYRGLSSLPVSDLYVSVFRNIETLLLGVAENRGPETAELDIRRELGRRRSAQGLPLHSLVDAYHIGYRELWAALVIVARDLGGDAPGLLLTAGSTVWAWIHAITMAVTEDYRVETERNAAAQAETNGRLLDLIRRDPSSSETEVLARGMGFDPDGEFIAAAFPSSALTAQEEMLLLARLSDVTTEVSLANRGPSAFVTAQGTNADAILEVVANFVQVFAVGLSRRGLEGARLSILDAERCLPLAAARNEPVRFDEDWLIASVLTLRKSLSPLLENIAQIAREKPHLAEAVVEFQRADMSVTDAARVLMLGATSVRHRLNQWKKLTGLDPWSWNGLTHSTLAISLSNVQPTPVPIV